MLYRLSSLKVRKTFVILWLTVAIITAGLAAGFRNSEQGSRDDALPDWVEFLIELELAHILVHLVIFGLVAVLLGEWKGGSRQLAWRYVIVGALMMEAVQVLAGIPHEDIPALIVRVIWDFLVDGIAGWLGLWLVERIKMRGWFLPYKL